MARSRAKFLLRTLWLAAVAAVVILSLLPPALIPLARRALDLGDKALHFLAYAALAAVPAAHEKTRVLAGCLAALVCLGVAVELVQRLSLYRSFELLDVAANVAGLCAGGFTARLWMRLSP
jgi:VanZ family protein